MRDEPGLLQAIKASLHDDGSRLVYADWLEENGQPDRAEYLRLQCELARTWSYQDQKPALFKRLAQLRKALDPDWLALVRRCTTPAPPVDLARALPQLKKYARTTVRLHPRRGEAPMDASKIGGTFLWPAGEPWPRCEEHDSPFVTVLQLRKEDVPELRFRRGTDLFQVLWCPTSHEVGYCPAPRVFWRKRAAVKTPVASHPELQGLEEDEEDLVPRPCLLYPERVVEYPDPSEGVEEIEAAVQKSADLHSALEVAKACRVGNWRHPRDVSHLYQVWLTTADGTKVGGYPKWAQNPEYPTCSCGKPMEHLVSFASWEFDGVTWGRWLPIEDRESLTADYLERESVKLAAGWLFGCEGNMYLFVCRHCEEWPTTALISAADL